MLDRQRHEDAKQRIRETGARIRLITDGDVAGAMTAAREGSAIDLLYGVGGTPEGVLAAAAIRCLGGEIQARLAPQSDEERARRARSTAAISSACSRVASWSRAATCSSPRPA